MAIITATVSTGGGVISPSGAVNVTDGSDQTFTYSANPGYEIHKIFVDGIELSIWSDTSYTFYNVTSDRTIFIWFTEVNEYELKVNNGSGSGTYYKNVMVPIIADSPSGYIFNKWICNRGSSYLTDETSASTTIKMPDGKTAVFAIFAPVSESNGSIGMV